MAVQDASSVHKALQNTTMLLLDAVVRCRASVLSGTSTPLTAGTCMVEILTEDKY